MLQAAPESRLALHLKGCELNLREEKENGHLCYIRDEVPKVVASSMRLVLPPPNADKFYETHVALTPADSAALCRETLDQKGQKWHSARRLRLTASDCHEWWTYQGSEWKNKVEEHMSRFSGNAATQYGRDNEAIAILAYEKSTGRSVTRCGFIVPPGAAWVGCSPDGVVCDLEGSPQRLVVKCAVVGEGYGLDQLRGARMPPFLCTTENGLKLKCRHRYYSQVQLSMAIIGVKSCDLVIYSKAEKAVMVVEVAWNPKFCEALLRKLHDVYFKHILPYLVREHGGTLPR